MQQVKIGWASRDVSTSVPINIPGQFHMRISKGIMDPLTLTALVIDNSEDLVIFLSADLVVIRSGLLDEVREQVSLLEPEIETIKIIMNATHTHTGASHYLDKGNDALRTGSSTAPVDDVPHPGVEIASSDDYRAYLAREAAEAVVEAYRTRAPGGIAYGYGFAVVSHSRRVIYFDDTSKRPGEQVSGFRVNGHGVMYGNTRDKQFSHYEAGADHFINLLYTFTPAGELTGAIINVPCPSQNSESEYKLSADYWHDVRVAVRKIYGNIHILPQSAAGGDLSPRLLHYKEAQARRFRLKYGNEQTELSARKDIAERVAAAFAEVLSWAKNDIRSELPIEHVVETVELSKRRISQDELAFAEEKLAELNKIPFKLEGDSPEELLRFNSSLVAQRNRFIRIVGRYKSQDSEPKLPMEMHVLRIGNIAFASNRFELFMDFMHRIQARSPFEQTFVIQLAGTPGMDGGTYLATERAVQNKGYSACLFCNIVSPEGGQEMVDETVSILEKLYDNKS
ncbi:MAG: hypothetical protein SCM11_18715 [Bacillota bacterium]|nr:hypothetical protein [Bacillota bacterium]